MLIRLYYGRFTQLCPTCSVYSIFFLFYFNSVEDVDHRMDVKRHKIKIAVGIFATLVIIAIIVVVAVVLTLPLKSKNVLKNNVKA